MRHPLIALFAASSLALGAQFTLANDRDIGPDEARQLQEAGTIQSFEALDQQPWPSIPAPGWKTPSWKRKTAATCTRSSCAMRRISSGI